MSLLRKNQVTVTDIGETCEPIEILIGGDMYVKFLTGRFIQINKGIAAIDTKLGWTLLGEYGWESRADSFDLTLLSMTAQDVPIANLWKLETIGIEEDGANQTKAQVIEEAKENFMKSIKRREDGRYCVSLPWVKDHPPLPTNRNHAVGRLERETKKLMNTGHFEQYDRLLKEWAAEFTERVEEGQDQQGYYIPHRPVIKDSLTTPVRPVFDCSCRVGKGPSLNECLHTGTVNLQLIPELLLRFREKRVGVTADIRKAFQMIEVDPSDRKYLQFLWWEDFQAKRMVVYRHARVLFGATCSPFILGAVLEYHLSRVPVPDKEDAMKLLHGLYVDNYVGSEDTYEGYRAFERKATQLLAEARMDLRMWMSNQDEIEDPSTRVVSILGMKWDRKEDNLSPALLTAKKLLQKAWIASPKWDEPLTPEIGREFKAWFDQLHFLQDYKVPRLASAGESDRSSWSVHVFTDASTSAFACAAFLRVKTAERVSVQLLMSKARLSPVKRLTIPRLELMGCVIGSRIAALVRNALKLEDVPWFYWCDSTTVLAWIKGGYNYQTFVRNRVKEVREKTDPSIWRFVPGVMNPADLPSRGFSPAELLQSRWTEGPEWLKLDPENWPSTTAEEDPEAIMAEVKPEKVNACAYLELFVEKDNTHKYTFTQHVRIMGWVKRFLHNWCVRHKKTGETHTGALTVEELEAAEYAVLKEVQEDASVNKEMQIANKTMVLYRDTCGVFRVKSKLIHRDDLMIANWPILLPRQHVLTKMIIKEAHEKYYHAGSEFLMASLRAKYWITQSRQAIRQVIRKCVRCQRYSSEPTVVEEGALPKARTQTGEPFEVIGIDLAGPLNLRGGKKSWMVIYTCASYRAVFLDLVNSLSTRAFIKSIKRFIEKHGRPREVYTDNGTHFRGANNLFRKINWEEVKAEENLKPIRWIFNPPSAAWWGGWWERLIKSVKELLRRTLGKSCLSFAEMKSCLEEVTVIMNGRLLTYVSDDPESLLPLTPALFLRTPQSASFPEADLSAPENLRRRYRYVQAVKDELKKRFVGEYLGMLVARPKKKARSLKVGDLVFIGSDNQKRIEWRLGRVLELYPGRDGQCRVAKLKTAEGVLTRPAQRLHIMEMDQEELQDIKRTRSGRMVIAPQRLQIN